MHAYAASQTSLTGGVVDPSKPLLCESLVKFTKGGGKSHAKTVA